MRKYYIDNLRWLTVLLLFPYHTFMIYNTFGESYYIKGADLTAASSFITALWPWMMPFMFVIAGISTAFALEKRTVNQYIKERFTRLFLPLFFGILFIIPSITYFAERFHNSYTGNYFAQYILFFTKPTDLTGYQGGFTPAHLWFLLYLLVISIISVPLMILCKKKNLKLKAEKYPLPLIILLFSFPLIMRPVLNIAGKSIGEYFAFFILGYFVLSNEAVLKKVDEGRLKLTGIFIAGIIFVVSLFIIRPNINRLLYDVLVALYAWCGILTLLGLGRHYLNFRNKTTDFFSQSSFSVYIFHHSWIVAVAFCVVKITQNASMQIILILLGSIPLTLLTHEVFKRFWLTRRMFGLR